MEKKYSVYTHLFFDLDHTLWDFETNSSLTLEELYVEFGLQELTQNTFDQFHGAYKVVNERLWDQYRRGQVDKLTLRSSRFTNTLKQFGVDNRDLGLVLEDEYINRSPRKTALFDGTLEVLQQLSGSYHMHIITNGFSEVQDLKLVGSGLDPYFTHRITSEGVGVNKPDPRIFLHALRKAGAKRKESLMIGDNLEVDIAGARRVGMDQVYFNPLNEPHEQNPTYEIKSMRELPHLLGK